MTDPDDPLDHALAVTGRWLLLCSLVLLPLLAMAVAGLSVLPALHDHRAATTLLGTALGVDLVDVVFAVLAMLPATTGRQRRRLQTATAVGFLPAGVLVVVATVLLLL